MNNLALHLLSAMFVVVMFGLWISAGVMLSFSLHNLWQGRDWEEQDTLYLAIFSVVTSSIILAVLS